MSAENVNRVAKAIALADAFEHLAAPATDVKADPADVLAFAMEANEERWEQVVALHAPPPVVPYMPSRETRAATLAVLAERANPTDPFDGFDRDRSQR